MDRLWRRCHVHLLYRFTQERRAAVLGVRAGSRAGHHAGGGGVGWCPLRRGGSGGAAARVRAGGAARGARRAAVARPAAARRPTCQVFTLPIRYLIASGLSIVAQQYNISTNH